MTHCNCKQMGSDTQLLIEQSNSTLLDRYKRSVKFKSCPNIVTPVIFVYSSIYLKCLIIRKMPATFFKTPLPPYWQFGIAPANRRPPSNSLSTVIGSICVCSLHQLGHLSTFYLGQSYKSLRLGTVENYSEKHPHYRPIFDQQHLHLKRSGQKVFCRIGPRKRPCRADSRGMESGNSCRIKKLQLISIIYFFHSHATHQLGLQRMLLLLLRMAKYLMQGKILSSGLGIY